MENKEPDALRYYQEDRVIRGVPENIRKAIAREDAAVATLNRAVSEMVGDTANPFKAGKKLRDSVREIGGHTRLAEQIRTEVDLPPKYKGPRGLLNRDRK